MANMYQKHLNVEGNLLQVVLCFFLLAVGKASFGIATALAASVCILPYLLLLLKATEIALRGNPKIPIPSLTTA